MAWQEETVDTNSALGDLLVTRFVASAAVLSRVFHCQWAAAKHRILVPIGSNHHGPVCWRARHTKRVRCHAIRRFVICLSSLLLSEFSHRVYALDLCVHL
jgi:hypothetical protein